jgi:tetratricopeptide (TPR) repeat protein
LKTRKLKDYIVKIAINKMKKNLLILLFVFSWAVVFSQSYKDNFNKSLTPNQRQELKNKIHEYSQMIKEDKYNPTLFLNRGVVYSQLGYHNDAITDYNSALKLDSTMSQAYYNRGLSRSRFRYSKRSCADIKKSYELGLDIAKSTYIKHCRMYFSELGELK